jgi:predicted nucleic acid-binding protein
VPFNPLIERAERVLASLALLPVDRLTLVAAGAIEEPGLRALDAVHVASALDAGRLDAFVTYDERQAAAARLVGLRTIAPGA